MKLWPIHPKPHKDELLSSWIHRISFYYSMESGNLIRAISPDRKAILREIDRLYSPKIIEALAEGTNTPIEAVMKMSLASDEGYIYSYRQYGNSSWIQPTFSKDISTNKGMPYCPLCLADDSTPYYRKSWRYVFNTICATHKIFLRLNCPHCSKPYNYTGRFEFPSNWAGSLKICRWCNFDLSGHAYVSAQHPAIDNFLESQEKLWVGINKDDFLIPGYGHVHAFAFLRVFHGISNLMLEPTYAKWVASNYPHDLPKGLDCTFIDNHQYGFILESQSPAVIAHIICLSESLIQDWPNRLEKFILENEIGVHKFFPNKDIPFWFTRMLNNLCFIGRYVTSAEEIESATQILRRKLQRKELPKELKRFMYTGKAKHLIMVNSSRRKEIELSPENFRLEFSDLDKTTRDKKVRGWKKLVDSADRLSSIAMLRKDNRKVKDLEGNQLNLL